MPMIILLIGVIVALAMYEIEGATKDGIRPTIRTVAIFKRVRASWPMLLLVLVAAVLAAFEIYFVLRGDIYKDGISWQSFLRLALLVAGASSITYARIRTPGRWQMNNKYSVVGALLIAMFLITIFFEGT